MCFVVETGLTTFCPSTDKLLAVIVFAAIISETTLCALIIFALIVFALIAFILVRPIAYKLLGIPLPHERKAAEQAEAMRLAAEQTAEPVLGPDGQPLPAGAVGVNADGVPVGSDGAPIIAEGEIEIEEGESLEEIRAKLKPKKSSISADLLDTANTYDDKVALIRMLVQEDSGRVATVLKSMIKAS